MYSLGQRLRKKIKKAKRRESKEKEGQQKKRKASKGKARIIRRRFCPNQVKFLEQKFDLRNQISRGARVLIKAPCGSTLEGECMGTWWKH